MCLVSPPSAPKLQEPTEYAQQRAPDGDAVRTTTGRRATDRVRGATPTVLTSGSGVSQTADVGKKTLLGQ